MDKLKRFGVISTMCLAWCSVSLFFVWTIGVIYYFSFLPQFLCSLLAMVYFIGGMYLFFKWTPKSKWLNVAAISIALVYVVSLVQQPRNDRTWDADQAKMAKIQIQDDHVSIKNFRSNQYRTSTDYDAHFEDFEFELSQLNEVWFLVQRFTAIEGLAHTFVTFGLETEDGPQYFSVSVEIRREAGEIYSPIQGMYRQYELMYVFGDEKDLIGVRTVMRPEDRVFMYRTNATPDQVQTLFTDIAQRANRLQERPEFYNTFVNNCTNNIVRHTYQLTPQPINWLDPRVVLPGYSDRFAFSKELIGQKGQSFDDLVTESRIDEKAREFGIKPGFSTAIRRHTADSN